MSSTKTKLGAKFHVVIMLPTRVKLIAPDFQTPWDARDWIEQVVTQEKYCGATFRIVREEDR